MCTHMRRHNPEKLFKCNNCYYEGIQTAILDSHIQSTHNNLWYHCDLCEYKANHNCNITKHVQIKHEGLVFGCDDCDNKSTSNARVLSTKSHIIKKLDRCDSCHFKLSDKQALKVHKESKHFGIEYDKKKTIAESAQGFEA